MSDQKLRDQLVEEFVGEMLILEGVTPYSRRDFKAGWDAARGNDEINNSLRRALDSALGHKRMLENERDQIKNEVERLKAELGNAEYERNMETSQLIAAAEKLTEALSFSLDGLAMWRKYGSPGNIAEVEERTRQALAEYRETVK